MNRYLFTLVALVLLVPVGVKAQTSSVTLRGTVSKTVALSVLPNSSHNNIQVDAVSSGGTVRMTLSGTDAESPVLRVPLIVRSNSGFKISAVAESNTTQLTQLSVIDARDTGPLVSTEAVSGIEVAEQFDLRRAEEEFSSVTNSSPLDISRPLLVLSGPRISTGGTLASANNALQITLLIRMKPQPGRDWLVHLTFAATAVDTF